MPCYRCGVRQTDPSRGQSPWKRGVRQYSQILICPGCQETVDWMADLDRCSRCSSVHLVKRLGEVECRDCGAVVAPEDSADAEYAGGARMLDGELAGPAGLAASGGTAGPAGSGLGEAWLQGAGPAGSDRSPDLSEEVARALDRVLGQSLVSQSIQRAPDPEGEAGPGSGPMAGAGAGRHRPARTAAGHHAAAHPGAERHRAARPGMARQGDDRLDEVRPGAFAG